MSGQILATVISKGIELKLVEREIPEIQRRSISSLTDASEEEISSRIEDWKWPDFVKFFNSLYQVHFGPAPKLKISDRGKYKAMIESSVEHYGAETFKKMIEWLFQNYKSYPQWSAVTFSLVCGTHYYATMIHQKVVSTTNVEIKDTNW